METTEKEWLKVPEAAELLGLPKTRAYELIQQGELPAVRIGERSIRVNRAELETFLLETRRVVASQTGRPDSCSRIRGERI
jgi:excisionase family DNA binding protein